MRVSVAMTIYNGARYIREQLESLRVQIRPADEVIICDDCSTDETPRIVREFITKHNLDGWRLLENEQNLGYRRNFKYALQKCTGDVVFFCDQDDVWHADKIKRCVQIMQDEPQVQVLVSEYEPLASAADAPKVSAEAARAMTGDGSLQQMALDNAPEIWIGCAMALRREFIDAALPFWVDELAHDTWAWMLSLAVGGCYLLHERLLDRRLHAENVSMRSHHELSDRINLLEEKLTGSVAACMFAEGYRGAGEICELNDARMRQLRRSAEFNALRLLLVKDGKLEHAIGLLSKLDMYPHKRSLLVEMALAVNGRRAARG